LHIAQTVYSAADDAKISLMCIRAEQRIRMKERTNDYGETQC
jgi:hypothetical protein